MILDKFFREAKFTETAEEERHDPYFILNSHKKLKTTDGKWYFHTYYKKRGYKGKRLWCRVHIYSFQDFVNQLSSTEEIFISYMDIPFLSATVSGKKDAVPMDLASKVQSAFTMDEPNSRIRDMVNLNYRHTTKTSILNESSCFHGTRDKFIHAISSATPSLLPTKKEMENLIEEIQALNTMDRIKNL